MKMQAEDDPLYLFRFDDRGKHSGKIVLENADDLAVAVDRAIHEKETVTITDTDDVCVFRCERGTIAWPRLDSIFGKKDLDGYGLDLSGLLS